MITFVGMGPGDPELLTRRAVRALREADILAVPEGESGTSTVLGIAGELAEGKEILRLYMPMRGTREQWQEAHKIAADRLREALDAGKSIAYPVLGDPMLYATSSYLLALLKEDYETEVVPGITSMCAMAAALKQPLCEARETLEVRPGFSEGDTLPKGNVVVMKAASSTDALMKAGAGREMYYARNLGMREGSDCGRLAEIDPEKQSYFTTVLVKAAKKP